VNTELIAARHFLDTDNINPESSVTPNKVLYITTTDHGIYKIWILMKIKKLFLGCREQPVHEAVNLTAICDLTV
jgi:hypothetical protein